MERLKLFFHYKFPSLMGQYKSYIGWSLWNIIGEGNESQGIFRIGSNNASLGASNIEGEGGAGGCVSGGL